MLLLNKTLRRMPEARVQWPTEAEQTRFGHAFGVRYPTLSRCFGFLDGVKVLVESPALPSLQSAYYNG